MTSKQVMLTTIVLLTAGCSFFQPKETNPLVSPYPTQRVWAVAPMRNESGSLQADGLKMADHIIRHLDNTTGLQVIPLNRTLQAMETLKIQEVTRPEHVKHLLRVLGVDALVVGSITAYDPYDPPKIGLAVELWIDAVIEQEDRRSVRELSRASNAVEAEIELHQRNTPDNTISDTLDASDPYVRDLIEQYAVKRGVEEKDNWRRYRISMDLYSEFVTYVISWRLLDKETQRITPTDENESRNKPAP